MRPENIAMLQDTLDILEQGYYLVGEKKVELKLSNKEMREIHVYLPEEIQAISENRDSFSLAIEKRRKQALCLKKTESRFWC